MTSNPEITKEVQSQFCQIECPLCGKDYRNKALLKEHFIQNHTPQFPAARRINEVIIEKKEEEFIVVEPELDQFEWEDSINVLNVKDTFKEENGYFGDVHETQLPINSENSIKPEVSKLKWEDSVEIALSETGNTVKIHKKKICLSQNGTVECPRCGEEFQNKQCLKEHFIKEHSTQGTNGTEVQGQIQPENETDNINNEREVTHFKWKNSVKHERIENGSLVKVYKKNFIFLLMAQCHVRNVVKSFRAKEN